MPDGGVEFLLGVGIMNKRLSVCTALLMLVAALSLFTPSIGFADDFSTDGNGEFPVSISFQLKDRASQEYTVILPDGTESKIGIEYIPTVEPYNAWDSYYQNASGTWRVYYNSVIFQEFYIKIGNHKITDAWGSNYSVPLGTASDYFTWNSTRALQRVNVSIPGVYTGNVFLGAEMQGTTLHTYAY